MTFTYKLSKRLAVIRPLVIAVGLFGCTRDQGSTGTSIPDLTQLVLVPESVMVTASQTYQLVVFGRTAAGDSVTPQAQAIAWSSDDAAVATVSSRGLVTGLAAGSVTISATSNGKSAHARVKVDPGAPPPPPPPPPPPSPEVHAGWHVAASGSSSGTGTSTQPWSLTYALSGAAGRIQPGDTVWLHGGTYRGQYRATVAGTAGRPVVIRQLPGERATIDVAGATSTSYRGDAFVVQGEWTEWWDFEMMSSDPNRYTTTRPNMMVNDASNTKYIDLVIHDGGIGFYNYPSASNVEFNGNIIYNNGWQTDVRGGGHALYLKSATGPVVVRDNVMFDQFGYGIHLYTDAGAGQLINVTLDGNAAFNNGSLAAQYNSASTANILIGGEEPVQAARMLNNMTYFSPGIGVDNLIIGYGTFANEDVTMQNNYAVGGQYVLTTGYWNQVTAAGNQLIGSSHIVEVRDTMLLGYTWAANAYTRDPAASAWRYNGTDYSFNNWKVSTGLGLTDDASSSLPTTPKIFVRPSTYEPGRAMIVVYNWGSQSSVGVDLTGVLPAGANYEVRNVQDWFGTPVATGSYGGGTISIPMSGVTPPIPVGGAPHTPPQTGPDFDVFIVRPVK